MPACDDSSGSLASQLTPPRGVECLWAFHLPSQWSCKFASGTGMSAAPPRDRADASGVEHIDCEVGGARRSKRLARPSPHFRPIVRRGAEGCQASTRADLSTPRAPEGHAAPSVEISPRSDATCDHTVVPSGGLLGPSTILRPQ